MHGGAMNTEQVAFKCASGTVQGQDAEACAENWVQLAIASNLDPHTRQDCLSGEDPGEWKIVTRKHDDGAGLALPEELWDGVFILLVRMGRVRFSDTLKLWQGDFLPDNCTARGIGLRLKMARQALGMERSAFYGACGISESAGEALEGLEVQVPLPVFELASLVARRHSIPEAWLNFGLASEIEA